LGIESAPGEFLTFDKLVESRFISSRVGDERNSPDFISSKGKKKIVLVKKRDRVVDTAFPDEEDAQVEYLDQNRRTK
jgi:hypothetical protein